MHEKHLPLPKTIPFEVVSKGYFSNSGNNSYFEQGKRVHKK